MRLRFLLAATSFLVLACCVVYAASVSVQAPFSVQVLSSSSIPAPALAAGFTTCVLCMDFTAPSGGVRVNGQPAAGVNAADPSTWLDCAGASNPLVYKAREKPAGSCSPVGSDGHGSNAWNVIFPASSVSGYNAYLNELQDAVSNNLTLAQTLPPALFYRSIVWLPTVPTNVYINYEWLTGSQCKNAGCITTGLEFDGFEIDNRQGAYISTWINWEGGPSAGSNWQTAAPNLPNYPGGYDPTSGYHTIDMRITTDGNTVYKCMWIDTLFQSCVNASGLSSQVSNIDRQEAIIIEIGCNCNDPGFQFSVPQYNAYVKEFDIWSCPAWQTTNCSTSNPDPGNY